ncbi:MAG TPA: NAD(P)/FAD-dependent oxidoreductase [Candidatus Dormibacteraeota bacterium]|nr:NAD(P)/FAD-dependent oxidoreductase [Candidatus Dormibacteraeota bacterium]
MSDEREFDIICLGGGPAGEALAGELKGSDLSLAVIESNLVGGECPYWGCMPSKTLLRSAEVLSEADRARGLAASEVTFTVDYQKVYRRAFEMTRGLDDSKSAEALEKTGATLIRGAGKLVDSRQVEVEGRRLSARRAVVIATGTAPLVPPIDGLSAVEYWTNREAVLAAEQPERLIVLGAGPVGLELAQVFARLGTGVHLVESTPYPLPLEDEDAGKYVQEVLLKDGIKVSCGARAVQVSQSGKQISVTLESGDVLTADRLLVATGRKPNLDGLDLEAAGVRQTTRGFVSVDAATLRASDGVYAIGDINGIGGFTHLSNYHGKVLGRALRGRKVSANHVAVPRVTFTDPEVASVGLSEAQAREKGIDVKIGAIADTLNMTARGYIHGEPGGLVKLVADKQGGVLIGATLVGPTAGEMIHEMAVAIRAEVRLATLADTIHAFPTFSRDFEALFDDLAR